MLALLMGGGRELARGGGRTVLGLIGAESGGGMEVGEGMEVEGVVVVGAGVVVVVGVMVAVPTLILVGIRLDQSGSPLASCRGTVRGVDLCTGGRVAGKGGLKPDPEPGLCPWGAETDLVSGGSCCCCCGA